MVFLMFSLELHLDLGPCSRPSWHPQGRFAWARNGLKNHGWIVDLERNTRDVAPGERWVWAPCGLHALTEENGATALRHWPDTRAFAELPGQGWRWDMAGGLWKPERGAVWRADASDGWRLRSEAILPEGERWIAVEPLPEQRAIGLRWRSHLHRSELVQIWPDSARLETLSRPPLDSLQLGPWSWAAGGTAWAVADRSTGRIRAWTFPQGCVQADLAVGSPVWEVCHLGDALAWTSTDGLGLWNFSEQAQSFVPLILPPGRRRLAWNPAHRRLLVGAPDGLRLFLLEDTLGL